MVFLDVTFKLFSKKGSKNHAAFRTAAIQAHQAYFPFPIRCPAVSPAQNWQKPVGPRFAHLLSGEVWLEVALFLCQFVVSLCLSGCR